VFDGKAYITALNETPQNISLKVEYGYMGFDGKTAELKTAEINMEKHSFNELPAFSAGGSLTDGFYFARPLNDAEIEPATSLRGNYRIYNFPEFKARIVSAQKEGNDYLLSIKADTYVPFAQLLTDDDRVRMSDNFFELLPGTEKKVRVYNCGKQPELRLIKVEKA
jgi:hypothetical protein